MKMDASYYKKYEPIFGAWKIKKKLGEGNFGAVFEIEREDFGTTYHSALKAITIPKNQAELDSIMNDGMDASATQKYLEQFVEKIVGEFVLMSKLKGNSNVVSYEDHQVIKHEDGIGWDILIRMELLTPMMTHFKTNAMTRRDVIKLGIDMCRALELCQKYNIIHRDIKPENIFISDSGDYKLGDFGIAKEVEKTQSGLTKTGTPTYMAPEVYKGQPYGSSVDLYSLGVVLYRLLNHNRAPFMPQYPNPISYKDKEKAFIMRVSGQKFPMPTNAGSGRLAEIAMKACSYKPEDRYSSPTQMREDLEAILYTEGEGVIMFPGGDNVDIKSIGYVSDGKKSNKQLTSEELTELLEDDATELLNENGVSGKTKINKIQKSKKKILIPLLSGLCVIAVGVGLFFALKKDNSKHIEYDLPTINTEAQLVDPVEFSIDVLHMSESDFNTIKARLEMCGIQYTANKENNTFAVSKNDLGSNSQEIITSIRLITGVGKVVFSDPYNTSVNFISRNDIDDLSVSEDESQLVAELNDEGKLKLNLLLSENSDTGNDMLSLYIDGKELYSEKSDYMVKDGEIVLPMPFETGRSDMLSILSMKVSADDINISNTTLKLIISVIVNDELSKEYDIYIDEKYGLVLEDNSPKSDDINAEIEKNIEVSEELEETEKAEDTENKENKEEVENAKNTKSKENVSGQESYTNSKSETTNAGKTKVDQQQLESGSIQTPIASASDEPAPVPTPTCPVCGSSEHITHPTCPVCGSTEHTVHPVEQIPSAPVENAGMPEIYIDFD